MKNYSFKMLMLACFVLIASYASAQSKVAYVTLLKDMDASAASVAEDPIIKMLDADSNIDLTVLVTTADADLGDLSVYDAVIAQESFGSSSAIFAPGSSLGMGSIPVPFILNKAYTLRAGRGFAADTPGSGGENGNVQYLSVSAANQANDLFKGLAFAGDSVQVFRKTANDDGSAGGTKALQFATNVVISEANTLLASGTMDPVEATVCLNDIPAGATIGSETLQARMIAMAMNFGAITKDKGTNFTSEGLTIWRNAVYSLVGLDVPSTPVDAPDPAPKKVAYVSLSKTMADGASAVAEDPIIKMLQSQEGIELTVVIASADQDLGDLSGFDAVVAQESFGSSSAIFAPGASLGMGSIPVPFILNKAYTLRAGRGFAADTPGSGGENGNVQYLAVSSDNQANDLFKGLSFVGDSVKVFRATANDDGSAGGTKALQYATNVVISEANTLLASGTMDPAEATVCLNDIPAGATIGSETLQARMIAMAMNFGAISKNQGTNFTSEGLTIWRNAVFSLVGLAIPDEMVEAPVAIAIKTHSYDFEDGTADDVVGAANGVVEGGTILDGKYTATELKVDFISLPAADIAINTYSAISVEAYITADGVNPDWSMLTYFGSSDDGLGIDGYFVTVARADDVSRTAISTGSSTPWADEDGVNGTELADGEKHHVVSTIDGDSIKLYIDGELIGTTALVGDNTIANLSNDFAWLCRGGYANDNSWAGTLHEVNIYEGVLTTEEVAENAANWPVDAITPRKVAYITQDKVMESTNQPGNDPIVQLMSMDPNFDIEVMTVADDAVIDLSGYDLVVGQEPFGSSSAIWQPGGTLGMANIAVPFIHNKAYTLRGGRGFAADTPGSGGEVAETYFLQVSAENQANPLFSGITFEGDSVQLFNSGATDGGADGTKGLQYATDVVISVDGTKLGGGTTDPDNATVSVNVIPAGTMIGSETLQAQMIEICQNYGAICNDANMTDANYTLWRNAFYVAVGLEVPTEAVDASIEIEVSVETGMVAEDGDAGAYQVTVPMGTTSVDLMISVISGDSVSVPTIDGLADGQNTQYEIIAYGLGGSMMVYPLEVHVQAEVEVLYLSASKGVYAGARAFDTNIYDALVGEGYSVTLLKRGGIFEWTPDGIMPFDYTPYAGMVISAGEGSSNVNDFAKRNYPVPCVTMQPDGPRNDKFGWVDKGDGAQMNVTKSYDALTAQMLITNVDHPITAGYNVDQVIMWSAGTPDSADWAGNEVKSYDLTDSIPGAIALARIPADGSSLTSLWAIPAGSSVRSMNGDYATYERVTTASNVVLMSVFNDGLLYATEAGMELMLNSLEWAMTPVVMTKSVAYVTYQKDMDGSASIVSEDPIIKMLEADESIDLTVMAVAADADLGDLSMYDAVVVQEGFGSGSAILKPGSSLGLASIPVPFVYNKMYGLRSGRGLTSGDGASSESSNLSYMVDAANQSNDLFKAITFAGDTFQVFRSNYDDTGAAGSKSLNYNTGNAISGDNTLIGSPNGVADAAFGINDLPAGTVIDSETTISRMIAVGMNFGAISGNMGTNFTNEGLTFWRNAVYSLVGLAIPAEVVIAPPSAHKTELMHSYTFEDGTADDVIGDVDGTLSGTMISIAGGKATVAGATGSTDGYITFDGAALALNTYAAISLEAYVYSAASANASYTMLAYFGNNTGGNRCFWIQPTRATTETRIEANNGTASVTALLDGTEIDDGEKHHLVAVLSADSIIYYIDGVAVASTPTAGDYISTLDTEVANLFKGADGWSDPNYNASVGEFNIYNGALTAEEVAANNDDWPTDVAVNNVESANGVMVYPNPASDYAKVSFTLTESANVSLSVYNMLGQKVNANSATMLNAGSNNMDINTQNLENGMYIYRLQVSGVTYQGKFNISK